MSEITILVADEDYAYFQKHELRGDLERAFGVLLRSHKLKTVDINSYVDAAGHAGAGTMSEAAVNETTAIDRARRKEHARLFPVQSGDTI